MYIADSIDELVNKVKDDIDKLAQILHPLFISSNHTWCFADGTKVPSVEQIQNMMLTLIDDLNEEVDESECGGINIRLRKTEEFVNPFYMLEVYYVPSYFNLD